MKQLNGSEIVIECLKEQGVDTVFGYPGGCILNIYDELYKHSDEIRHVLTSHEQGAAHAADGYARATGKVGVCMATSGPGATNLVTGIATAYMDSIPLVAITANVGVSLLGKDSFQEVDIAGVTLHVGLGTFRPVKVDDVENHHMHSEYFEISKEAADMINLTKENGGRIICVGTTSCRTVESAVDDHGKVKPGTGNTEIFIYPGYDFKVLDGLITNFHLPESTLIMLVSALAGRESVLYAYSEAVKEKYRFYSYGDCMLIR